MNLPEYFLTNCDLGDENDWAGSGLRMKHIKTIEEAQTLPEIDDSAFDYKVEILSDGSKKYIPVPRMLFAEPLQGDDICLFTDKDGRVMKVVYTESGAKKARWG